MAQPWKVLDSVNTDEGVLQLRQRGEGDFLITVGSLVLMNSLAHRSEVALGEVACAGLRERTAPRVLVAGLGMGYTLRAVLDQLPESASVLVADLNPVVVKWCEGPLAAITGGAVSDSRVEVEIADVTEVIRRSALTRHLFDCIVLDLYQGPNAQHKGDDPLYGTAAIETARAALKPGGVLAVWGENVDAAFAKRLTTAGFGVTTDRPGRGGLRHVIYIARLKDPQRDAGPRRHPGRRPQK